MRTVLLQEVRRRVRVQRQCNETPSVLSPLVLTARFGSELDGGVDFGERQVGLDFRERNDGVEALVDLAHKAGVRATPYRDNRGRLLDKHVNVERCKGQVGVLL